MSHAEARSWSRWKPSAAVHQKNSAAIIAALASSVVAGPIPRPINFYALHNQAMLLKEGPDVVAALTRNGAGEALPKQQY